jgi:hypothetical protein
MLPTEPFDILESERFSGIVSERCEYEMVENRQVGQLNLYSAESV